MNNETKIKESKMELKEFVKKYQIAVCQDGKDRKIRADSSIARCPSDLEK